jgi:hypothetical protein
MIDAKERELEMWMTVRDIVNEFIKEIEGKQSALDEVNPNHSPTTGRFQKKGKAGVYSLTQNASDDVAKDTDLKVPARGNHSGDNKNIRAKFGMNTSKEKACGRLTIDGEKKPKNRRCNDYPETYEEEYIRKTPESDYIKKKKKETERRNKNRDKMDLVPRSVDTPAVRREKIVPGSKQLSKLARGIAEIKEELSMPIWDIKTFKLKNTKDEKSKSKKK